MEPHIRPLQEGDLPEADRVFRLAFGTLLGLPDPMSFGGDADLVRTRYRADPSTAFAAQVGQELVGSVFVTCWGSLGLFGPLTVRPDFWNRGLAKELLEPALAVFDQRGVTHAGLFTNLLTPKNVNLYQKFGFWPGSLTAIMSKPVSQGVFGPGWQRYSEVPDGEKGACLSACREVTGSVCDELDVGREVRAVAAQGLGDTVLVWDRARLLGFAVCHCGPGSEAGSGVCYIKFGAVRHGPGAEEGFRLLLDACEALAAERGMERLVAGVSTARHTAYRHMMASGFRAQVLGVAMHRPNEPGYNRPDVFVVDDWR